MQYKGWKMRTGAPLSVLEEKNKQTNKTEWTTLFSVLSIPAFPTTLDDISPISSISHMCGKLLHQMFLAPVCETKRKPDASQTDE